MNDRYAIRVMDRFGSRDVLPVIPSLCSHASACIIAHPSDPGFVLEGCPVCEVVYNYNIQTGECKSVYNGSYGPLRMCLGPTGSILVLDDFFSNRSVFTLRWKEDQRKLDMDKCVYSNSRLVHICSYVERFDVLVLMQENEEIAVKLGSETPIWKLPGMVGGHVTNPVAVTTDAEGNVYIGDGANDRILKIDGLTGDITSVLLLEEVNKEEIDSLFWSDTEPNLTLLREIKSVLTFGSLIDRCKRFGSCTLELLVNV